MKLNVEQEIINLKTAINIRERNTFKRYQALITKKHLHLSTLKSREVKVHV